MYYGQTPLFPSMHSSCETGNCVRVPLFDAEFCRSSRPPMQDCQRVILENPCRPGECAEVLLSVDACGNLVVCVRRDPRRECCCMPDPCCRPDPGCKPNLCRPARPPKPNRPCRPPGFGNCFDG